MATLLAPNPNPTVTRPAQIEPVFSSRQSETPEAGQVLEVKCYFPDGSYDAESERLADFGVWIEPERIDDCEQRLTRTLTRRAASRLAEAESGTVGILVK